MDVPSFDTTVFGPGISRWNAERTGSLDAQSSKIFDEVLNEMGRLSSKDDGGAMIEADTVCLLDFYVHEKVQRQGLGEDLFKSALKEEGLAPTDIAYDRPSPKLKPFLAKHFGLHNCLDQPNRFMVFKEHFGGIAARLQPQAG